jgi:hypothetical protein
LVVPPAIVSPSAINGSVPLQSGGGREVRHCGKTIIEEKRNENRKKIVVVVLFIGPFFVWITGKKTLYTKTFLSRAYFFMGMDASVFPILFSVQFFYWLISYWIYYHNV